MMTGRTSARTARMTPAPVRKMTAPAQPRRRPRRSSHPTAGWNPMASTREMRMRIRTFWTAITMSARASTRSTPAVAFIQYVTGGHRSAPAFPRPATPLPARRSRRKGEFPAQQRVEGLGCLAPEEAGRMIRTADVHTGSDWQLASGTAVGRQQPRLPPADLEGYPLMWSEHECPVEDHVRRHRREDQARKPWGDDGATRSERVRGRAGCRCHDHAIRGERGDLVLSHERAQCHHAGWRPFLHDHLVQGPLGLVPPRVLGMGDQRGPFIDLELAGHERFEGRGGFVRLAFG